jgi:hypothetical protein
MKFWGFAYNIVANPLMGYAIGGQEFGQGVGSISLIAA